MPTLLLNTVCEKVIIDENGVATLVALFNQFMAVIPQGATVPPNAVAPKEWFVFSIWEPINDSEVGKGYTQVTQVYYPDGNIFADSRASFAFEKDKRQQIRMGFVGIPISQQGEYSVRVSLVEGDKTILTASPLGMKVSHISQLPTSTRT